MEKETNLRIWDAVKSPPKSALKTIGAGRLKGFTDINPQYRYQAMTEVFGPCGIGWKYEIKRLWTEPGADGRVLAFSEVSVYVKDQRFGFDGWSDAIPGIGGSMLTAKESSGLYSSDECYKMATTDALSVAMKMLGVGADVYMGRWDGSKYKQPEGQEDENVKRAVREWKQNIDTLAETAPIATIKAYWATNKAAIIKDCGQEQASVIYHHLNDVAKKVAATEGAA